jgi:hypothetical protein
LHAARPHGDRGPIAQSRPPAIFIAGSLGLDFLNSIATPVDTKGTEGLMDLSDNAAHILIVDDDKRIRDRLAQYLFENCFRVTAANDATCARASMRGLTFDLVLLDVMMPGKADSTSPVTSRPSPTSRSAC